MWQKITLIEVTWQRNHSKKVTWQKVSRRDKNFRKLASPIIFNFRHHWLQSINFSFQIRMWPATPYFKIYRSQPMNDNVFIKGLHFLANSQMRFSVYNTGPLILLLIILYSTNSTVVERDRFRSPICIILPGGAVTSVFSA